MADTKLSALNTISSIEDSDLVYIADNAAGSYTSKKTTVGSLREHILTAQPVTRGYTQGLTLAYNNTAPYNTGQFITVSPGCAVDNDYDYVIDLPTSINKNISQLWSSGTNNGGLDAIYSPYYPSYVAEDNSGYHCWLIANSTTSAVDVLFSQSPTSPTLPSGFDRMKRIGWVSYQTAALMDFRQYPSGYFWRGRWICVDSSTVGTTYQDVTPSSAIPPPFPLDMNVMVTANVVVSHASSAPVYVVIENDNHYPLGSQITNPVGSAYAPLATITAPVAGQAFSAQVQLLVSNGVFRLRSSHSNTTVKISVVSFQYDRGEHTYTRFE